MRAKEYLESIRKAWRLEDALKRQIQFEEASLMGGGIDYSKPSVNHSAKDQMFERIPEIVELMEKLEEMQRKNAHRRKTALTMLERISEECSTALLLYYFQCLTQEEAAMALGISRPTLLGRMERGIEELDEIFEKGEE